MLRKTLLSGLALALFLALPGAAQLPGDDSMLPGTDPMLPDAEPLPLLSLDEVLRNYYEAIGGEDAWMDVQSFKMTGTMLMGPGMLAPFTVYSARPDRLRLEFTFNGMTGIQAIDGDEAWMLMPFMGKTVPEAMPEDMTKQLKDQLDIEGPLVSFGDKGHTLEYLGPAQAQGTDAYKIKATLASGTEQVFYLDGEAFVPFLVEGKSTIQGNEVETETIFSDYKDVEGLMLAHSIEGRIKGQPGGQVITIEEVEVDGDLSEVEFGMPEIEAAEAAPAQ
ncbi:MAG: hypothetical protein OES32_15505 [Acidobacteriota bacterium]|nr:hypothetical protein [Acidobacteriota bacterium]MDH3524986.1 hypothetical protein [Acidobacteriota bacterium]